LLTYDPRLSALIGGQLMLRIFWKSAMNAFPGEKTFAVPPRRGKPFSASWAAPRV
jgi:hypothetical protein